MEQENYYLRVGIFATASVILALIVIGWFTPNRSKSAYTPYAIYFSGSVDGVSLGSPVRLKGITVGNVADITFDKHNNNRIFMRVDLMANTPIREDTVASVQALGITGTSFIALDSTGNNPNPKTANEDEPYPVIASRASPLEKVFASAPDLLEEIKRLSIRAEALLSDQNILALNQALQSINASAKSLEGLTGSDSTHSMKNAMQGFNEAMVESKLTLREIRMLARTLRDDPSLILVGTQHEGKKVP